MKQNIYDNPAFFAGYQSLRSMESGLNQAIEQPALCALLPPLKGKRILDLGCGFGHFCRYAAQQGATEITGIDISSHMLEEARRQTVHQAIRYIGSAIEDYRCEADSVDIVVSSLALHYVSDLPQVASEVFRWLAPDGWFVFSVEHPICTALLRGWCCDAEGRRQHWPVDHYKDEGQRQSRWFVDGVIKYHRTLSTYLNTLVDHKFSISRVLEPEVAEEFRSQRSDWAEERRRPPILLVSARKNLG